MPIDIHVRVAAWLHIVMGALAACVVVLCGSVFGLFGAAAVSQSGQSGLAGWVIGLFTLFFGYFIAYLALEILGGVLLLRGSAAGRVLTIVFSILSLLNFPVGTLLGAYSLWALLRTESPEAAPTGANVVHSS